MKQSSLARLFVPFSGRFVWLVAGSLVAFQLFLLLFFTLSQPALGAPLTPPDTPLITEPGTDGQVVYAGDVHMETAPFSDPDVGNTHNCSDWQIVVSGTLELVWQTLCIGGLEKTHTHLADGTFMGSLSGQVELLPSSDYRLRVRHQDNTGEWSNWAERPFQTGPASTVFPLEIDDVADPPAPTWVDTLGDDVILPAAATPPFVSLESPTGTLLVELRGLDGVFNQLTNPAAIAAHVAVRVHINAGDLGSNLLLPESDLSFTDGSGNAHTLYLPSISLTPTQSLYLWVAANGSSYWGSAAQTTPSFASLARGAPVPWAVLQPGYKVEVVATGFQLPVNIAFVPNPGPDPDDPFYYVTELYGTIKVVTRDGTVSDYATNLLNFNPTGNFPGTGEQGLAGIVVEPTTGDVYVTMLYSSIPFDDNAPHYPKVVRFQSIDGGHTAMTQTTVLDMVGESQGQSHQISNITIGPDGKLYVHMGDGFNAAMAQVLSSYRGKILRLNLDGTAPPDNPMYNAGNGINATDYIYAWGVRNPFGGAWRTSDGVHYQVENGPSVDRFSRILPNTNYTWGTGGVGTDAQMFFNAIYAWNPAHAPVNLSFIQSSVFGGSGFPAEKMDHAFVTESGPTWATGPQTRGKRIVEFVVDSNGVLVSGPTKLVEYNGSGKATAAAIAAGPDGLYFSDLYKDVNYLSPIDSGANILRIRFVGTADFTSNTTAGPVNATIEFTDTSSVVAPIGWLWDFGDGNTSTEQDPSHVYTAAGIYNVRLRVTGANGVSAIQKNQYILIGVGLGLLGEYYEYTGSAPPANPFQTFRLARIDPTLDFDWGSGSPAPGIANNLFSARWVGQIIPLFSESYTFYTWSDDGVRLWINNVQRINNWTNHAPTENSSAAIALTAGQRYEVRMEFFENGGGATARLSWSSASQPKVIIPRSQLYPPAELSLSQTANPNPVPAGQQLVYTVTVTNNGPSYASNVTLVDTLPAAVTFVSSTPGSPTCNHSSQVVTCNLAGLVSGQQQAIGIRVSVPQGAAGTTLTNTATLSSQMLDRNLADNSSSLGVQVGEPTAITLRQAAVAGNRLVFPTLLLVTVLLGVSLLVGRRRR
jgi:uncharacterized repeat protein (TIGR01451 family)